MGIKKVKFDNDIFKLGVIVQKNQVWSATTSKEIQLGDKETA